MSGKKGHRSENGREGSRGEAVARTVPASSPGIEIRCDAFKRRGGRIRTASRCDVASLRTSSRKAALAFRRHDHSVCALRGGGRRRTRGQLGQLLQRLLRWRSGVASCSHKRVGDDNARPPTRCVIEPRLGWRSSGIDVFDAQDWVDEQDWRGGSLHCL